MLFCTKQLKFYNISQPLYIIRRLLNKNKWYRVNMHNKNLPHRSDPIIKTLDTPEFKSLFSPELNTLADVFKKYNYDLRIVGGAVRDILMNIEPKDLDFATNATPTQMKEMFTEEKIRTINTNGEKHGTVTTRINNKQNFEITTIRCDIATNGRHSEVLFTTDWLLDASRRDLTINSLYLDLDGKIYDYYYGYDDLIQKRILFVGNPADRICEDFLRIFRYFRFYGRVSDVPDKHDSTTIKAITDNASGIKIISGERIWSEWSKIFQGNFSRELTLQLLECGCGKYMGLPEDINYEEFNKTCLLAQKNNIKLRPISYVSALLNNTYDVMNLFNRLKFNKYERNLALFLVRNRTNIIDENTLKFYQKSILKTTIKMSDAREFVCEILKYKGALNFAEEFQKWNLTFPFSGSLVIPFVDDDSMIAIVLSKLIDIWVDSNCTLSTDDLKSYLPEVVKKVKEEIESGKIEEQLYIFGNKFKKKHGKRKYSMVN